MSAPAALRVETLTGTARSAALDDIARLRIAVFREWPYLYDGDPDYERRYLESYRRSRDAIVVAAIAADRIVGAATGTPLADHAEDFAAAFDGAGYDLDTVFYCAESVLLPACRGRGLGHAFFDAREAHARALGFRHVAFCAVIRPDDHPLRPARARSLEPFWRGRGYAPLDGVVAAFSWKDVDQGRETEKQLQFWARGLSPR